MSESPDRQALHAVALESHDHLIDTLRTAINGIQAAANKLQTMRQQAAPVLEHTALSLRQLNPTATNAIEGLLQVTGMLVRDVTQRTASLQERIKAIPEPPPPAEEPPGKDKAANDAEGAYDEPA